MKQWMRVFPVMGLCAAIVMGLAVGAIAAVQFSYAFEEGNAADFKVKISREIDFGGYAMPQLWDLKETTTCPAVTDTGYAMEIHFIKVDASRIQGDNMAVDAVGEKLSGSAVSYTLDRNGKVDNIEAVGYVEA